MLGVVAEVTEECGPPAEMTVAEALWARYDAKRDRETLEALVAQYTPLVKYVVGRLAISLPAVLDFEDILSYGIIGLLDAISRFDPHRGIKFESYAIPRVRGSIIDALRSLDPLSRTARDRAREVERARVALEGQLGRPPSSAEVAGHLGITVDRYHQQCAHSSVTVLSLDGMIDVDSDLMSQSRGEFFVDKTIPSPPEVAEQRETLARLSEAIRRLPERERLVLSLYYNDELTMKEISHVLDVSESRVCQLHSQSVARLGNYMRDKTA